MSRSWDRGTVDMASAPRVRPAIQCCQHARYGFMLVNGVRHAQCADCGHCWLVVLGTGDTDYLPAEMPGIALR